MGFHEHHDLNTVRICIKTNDARSFLIAIYFYYFDQLKSKTCRKPMGNLETKLKDDSEA